MLATPVGRRSPSVAAETQSSQSGRGSFSIADLQSKFDAEKERQDVQDMLNAAVAWCEAEGKGPWRAVAGLPGLKAHRI